MTQRPTARKRANKANPTNQPEPPDPGPQKKNEEGKGKPEWPVTSGSQLTQDHIPQKLMDEIERPWRARARALARFALSVSDKRNDLVTGADRLSKEANKDSQAINREMQDPALIGALRAAGVNVQAPQQETPQGGGAGE